MAQMPKSKSRLRHWLNEMRLGLLLVMAVFLLWFILSGNVPGPEQVKDLLAGLSGKPWVWPAVIALFVVMSTMGVPQFVLIAGAVLAFGAMQGALMSWAGTMVSAGLQYGLARWVGAEPLQKLGGNLFRRMTDFVGRYGFWSAALVRLIPSGPFVLVNLAIGVSGVRLFSFLAGTGMGIVPKILAIALFGEGLRGVLNRQDIPYVLLFAGIGFLMLLALFVWGRRLARNADGSQPME